MFYRHLSEWQAEKVREHALEQQGPGARGGKSNGGKANGGKVKRICSRCGGAGGATKERIPT